MTCADNQLAATSAAAPACGSRGRSPSRRSRQGLVTRTFGEELVELVEVAVDEGLLEADGEERSLRLVTGLAQGFVRGQVAESAVDEAGGDGHPEGANT